MAGEGLPPRSLALQPGPASALIGHCVCTRASLGPSKLFLPLGVTRLRRPNHPDSLFRQYVSATREAPGRRMAGEGLPPRPPGRLSRRLAVHPTAFSMAPGVVGPTATQAEQPPASAARTTQACDCPGAGKRDGGRGASAPPPGCPDWTSHIAFSF